MDWSGLATALISGLRVPLIVLVVWFARRVFSKMPRVALPILAVACGVTADWLSCQAGIGQYSPLTGAMLGTAAVWLREVVNTAQEHGAQP